MERIRGIWDEEVQVREIKNKRKTEKRNRQNEKKEREKR